MASSSSRGLKYSRKNASPTVQVVQIDKSPNSRQSRKNQNDSTPGVQNGNISRRRSAPTARSSRPSQSQKPVVPSQRSRSNLARNMMELNGEDENDDVNEYVDNLNISSTSTATKDMEMSQPHDGDHSNNSINNSNQNAKTAIKKHELLCQYFTKVDTGGYYCKLCNGTKDSNKVHKQVPYSDANLRSHLARQHQLTQLLYPSQRLNYSIKTEVLPADLKKKYDNALIYAIIKDSRSFGDFQKPGFQHFLQVVLPNMNYKGPHRITSRRRMTTLYGAYRKALIAELSSVNDIALTADCWVSPRRMHFLCITAHYYDKEFHYISKVISFRRFIGRSLALRIRHFIRNELKKLKINDKICSITTDNGANIKLATNIKEFGFRIPCLAHGLHLTVTGGLGLWRKKKKKSSSTQISTTDESKVQEEEEEEQQQQGGYTDIDDKDQVWEDDIESDDEDGSGGGKSDEETTSAPASQNSDSEDSDSEGSDEEEPSTQQVQRNDYDESEIEYSSISDFKEFIYNLLQRTRKLITTIHRSSNLDKYVRDQINLKQQESNKRSQEDNSEPVIYNELVKDFRVRWSSTFIMLTRFLMLSSILNAITFTSKNILGLESQLILKLSKLTFSHNDWNWLSALQFVLKRFEESTRLLSGRSYQTLALGKMILNGLKHFLSNRKQDEPMINHLKTLLLEKFEIYCEQNLNREVEEAITIASFLNPTTYFYLQDDENFIKKAKQLIVSKSKTEKFSSTRVSSVNSTPVPSSIPKMLKKPLFAIEAFLLNCEAPLSSRSTKSSTTKIFTIQQEIGYYISSINKDTDFQEYWNTNQDSLPILARIVRHFCVMPMSSVASESAFSMAGYIQRKQRCSMSATTLRYSMLLRNIEPHHIN